MPYIESLDRPRAEYLPANPGELNFAITQLLLRYLHRQINPYRYADLNECVGALECAKLEFVRRVVVPFEGDKCDLNGDVYDLP